jgi:twitching motility protein PilT
MGVLMGDLLPDPELNRLVREMNLLADDKAEQEPGGPAPGAGLDAPDLRHVGSDEPLERVLTEMVRRQASDLLLVAGSPPVLRVNGRLVVADGEPIDADEVYAWFVPHLGARSRQQLTAEGAADFSLRMASPTGSDSWRLRVNLQRQRGQISAALRMLPYRIPELAELGLPDSISELTRTSHGLVLLCGPTGTGKSTTLAALIGLINRTEARHIITIEEPVEYEHRNRSSIIEQVEIGSDSPSFAAALRSALRRDPDVILVGEMRDLETMATAITAAETGHLIFSTLHTNDVAQAIHRVVDVFPANQQDQIRQQLALSLHAVVCQQLVPTADGKGRVPAVEVMLATYAIRNHIRKGNLHQLYNELLVGKRLGMRPLEESLAELVNHDRITAEEARCRTRRPEELDRFIAGSKAP